MSETSAARKRRESDPLGNFLRYLDEIEQALMRRDAMAVTALLRKRTATHLPREVREELLAHSRMPRESVRAPIQFLRFQHRMTQLANAGERLPTAQTELRFSDRSAGVIRRRDADDRLAAAREKPERHDDDSGSGRDTAK